MWGYCYFSQQSWFRFVFHPVWHFTWCTLHLSRVAIQNQSIVACLVLESVSIPKSFVSLFLFISSPTSLWSNWLAILGIWCPLPAYRTCLVKVTPYPDNLLRYLLRKNRTPSRMSLPSKDQIAVAKLLLPYMTLCDPIDGSPWGSPSLGYSRQEHWSGLPFPSPMHEREKWKRSRSVSIRLFVTPWTAAYQAPLSMGFSRQEYWSGVPLPSPSSSSRHNLIEHNLCGRSIKAFHVHLTCSLLSENYKYILWKILLLVKFLLTFLIMTHTL